MPVVGNVRTWPCECGGRVEQTSDEETHVHYGRCPRDPFTALVIRDRPASGVASEPRKPEWLKLRRSRW